LPSTINVGSRALSYKTFSEKFFAHPLVVADFDHEWPNFKIAVAGFGLSGPTGFY
jgi:hypothetical protein